MAGNTEDQKKSYLNRPMTTCTDIGDGKRLCITISLQECLKALNQPPQSVPPKSKCEKQNETSKKTGSETGGGSKSKCPESCETSKKTGSESGSSGPGGTGVGSQSGSCGTGSTGGSNQNASSGAGGTGGGSCGTGSSGGSSPSDPSKPKCSPSCATYTNEGSGAGGGSQSGSSGTGGTGGSSQNASSGAGGTGGSQSGSCGTAGTGIGNQGLGWASEGPQATGNQNLSCGTGIGNQGRVCGTGIGNQGRVCETGFPRGGPGVGEGYGIYQTGSPGPKRGYHGYSQDQSGMGGGNRGFSQDQKGTGGGNQGFSCGHGSAGGGHQSYGNTGGGNQGFTCGQGGGGGGNQNFSHGPVRSPVNCGAGGTGVGNQGFNNGSNATGGCTQGFTGGSEGTIGRNERYCCDQGQPVNQKTEVNQACCDSGGTGLGMTDYSCPQAVQPRPEPKKGFCYGGPPDRGPGFCPKKEEIVGGGAGGGSGGGTGGSGGACGTLSVCREAGEVKTQQKQGEVKTQQKGYGVHHCGVVVGGTSVDCGTGASGGKPQGCSHINNTSTPHSSPAELGKSILEQPIKLAEHQTMPVSQDQEQTLVNEHSNTFFGDKHETNEPKNNLGSSSESSGNFSSDQYQTVYPQQASNIIEENNSFKKSQFINDTPSLLEQGLSKLLDLVRSYNKPMERARQEPDIERDHVPGCPFYDDNK